MRWFYNIRHDDGSIMMKRVHAGMLDGSDLEQATHHIEVMNKISAKGTYELVGEEDRTQREFDLSK